MFFSKIVLNLICIVTTLIGYAQDTSQQIVPNRFNAGFQESRPYVILISADGFRYDLASKYHAANLLRLRASGVTAAYMRPSYPSLTFPNHYSIITGMTPAHHGLVDNSYYDQNRQQLYSMSNKKQVADSSWYGGTPLGVLAEQQQMLSASFYWVASESAIRGVRPTYYYLYNEKIEMSSRIQSVIKWLQLPPSIRPHFICFYFPEVDHAAHLYGPDSKETEAAVHFVDESIGKMNAAVDSLRLPVNFIFVSDHGMTKVNTQETIPLPAAIDTAQFIIPNGDALLHLYAKQPSFIKPTYKALKKQAVDFDVYLATRMPKRWHYNKKEDRFNRIGDIILVPRLPKVFSINHRPTSIGKHGFDPYLQDMQASFAAWGPAFKQGVHIDGFSNIHVYPLIAAILGLHLSEPIDGDYKVLAPVLK